MKYNFRNGQCKNWVRNLKYSMIALFIVSPVMVNARDFYWEWKPEYYGEYRIGYGTSHHTNGYNDYVGRALLGTIQGVRLNKYAQIGIGVDGLMLTHYYKGQELRWCLDTYVDMRGFYPVNEKFKVFLDWGLGAITTLNADKNTATFFCQFGPGLQIGRFTLTTGLQRIGKKQNTFYSTIGLTF